MRARLHVYGCHGGRCSKGRLGAIFGGGLGRCGKEGSVPSAWGATSWGAGSNDILGLGHNGVSVNRDEESLVSNFGLSVLYGWQIPPLPVSNADPLVFKFLSKLAVVDGRVVLVCLLQGKTAEFTLSHVVAAPLLASTVWYWCVAIAVS